MADCGDRPIRWTWPERVVRCELREEVTGEHRHFRCCGRAFVTGPREDFPIQIVCFVSFVFSLAAWCVLSWILMADTNVLLTLTPFLSWALALICFLHAGFTDPGIVPLNLVARRSQQQDQQADTGIVDGADDPLFCQTCRFVRELGVHHCNICNICVKELDHHCGVVGNCIGARNKASFLGAMFFSQNTFTFAIVNSIMGGVHLAKNSELSLDTNTAFQVVSYVLGSIELVYTLLLIIFCLAVHYGVAEEWPFSIVSRRLRRELGFSRHFFTNTVKREPVSTDCACGHSKCSRVPSLLAEQGQSDIDTIVRDIEAGNIMRKSSEERPLKDSVVVQ